MCVLTDTSWLLPLSHNRNSLHNYFEDFFFLSSPISTICSFFFFFLIFFLSFVFLGPHPRYMQVPRLGGWGSNQSCCHRPTQEPQQCQIQAASVTKTMPDPLPTEQGQGSNPHPQRHCRVLKPLSYSSNSWVSLSLFSR